MMLKLFKEYKKYRWFITSSGKPVIGGKSAEQNESLMKEIFKTKKNYITIHTKEPGSPFSVILADIKNISEKDIEEGIQRIKEWTRKNVTYTLVSR